MLTIPNIITILRIFLIPIFVIFIVYKKYDLSLYIFIIASTTDCLDGLIARLKEQKTNLGAFLDPLADKLLLITAFLSLTVLGYLPKWLTIIIISRDIIVVIGWVSLYIQTGSTKVKPTLTGKLSNTFQMVTIGAILLSLNFKLHVKILQICYILTSIFAIISCIHYILRDISLYERTGNN